VHDPIHAPDPRILEQLRSAAPVLSGHALKLYIYICFHADRQTGVLEADEEQLLQFLSRDRKALHAGIKELQERGLCDVGNMEPANQPVRMVVKGPRPGAGDVERLSAPG
jgi:hypothetical protein